MKNSSSKVKILAKFGSLLSLGCLTLLPSIMIVTANNNQIVELANASTFTDGDSTEQVLNTNVDNTVPIDDDLVAMTINSPVEGVGSTFERLNESGGTVRYTVLTEDAVNHTGTVSIAAGTSKPTGILNIPAIVTDGDFTYTVTWLSALAFSNCIGLTSVSVPDSVRYLSNSCFQNCTSLISIKISCTSLGAEIIRSAFENCPSLNHIDVIDNPNYTMVGGVDQYTGCLVKGTTIASDCSNIVTAIGSAVLPETVETIEEKFQYCSTLTSINIPINVTSIRDDAFDGCLSLNHIDVSGNTNYTMVGGVDQYTGCLVKGTTIASDCSNVITTTHEVVLPETVIKLKSHAFASCSSLTSIIIPDKATFIGNNAFMNCFNLTNFSIPNKVASIGDNAFNKCYGLTSITIPDSVTSIGNNTFSDCSNLTGITIGSGLVTIPVNDYSRLFNPFNNCTSLNHIDVTGNSNFIMVGGVDEYTGCLVQGDKISDDCSNVRATTHNVILPKDVQSIGYMSFSFFGLINIALPDSVVSIDISAFDCCSNLTSIVIPDSVTKIKNSAFHACESLINVTIGSGISLIDTGAFAICENLTSVTINAVTPPKLENDVFLELVHIFEFMSLKAH